MKRSVWHRVVIGAVLVVACRGEPKAGPETLQSSVDRLVPQVEQAVGIKFSKPPKVAERTREQIRSYLANKLDQEFPTRKLEGVEAAYRLLELIPETLNLRSLLLPLYSEQVIGLYDPDSLTLFVVGGLRSDSVRLVLAHELVHALQHERLPLDSLFKDAGNADRLAAAQAVLEGHATVAMLEVILGGRGSPLDQPGFWTQFREQARQQSSELTPVFASAPLVIREELLFPYLGGATFMRWWKSEGGRGPLPTKANMPVSTEQILHHERYQAADLPVAVRFTDSSSEVIYEDTMGELELEIWSTVVNGGTQVDTDLPSGWGGDRFRVYRSAAGPALVSYTVWDDTGSAGRFLRRAATRYASHPKPGYRSTAEATVIDGKPGVRVVRAPKDWDRWNRLPAAKLGPTVH